MIPVGDFLWNYSEIVIIIAGNRFESVKNKEIYSESK